MYILNMLGLKEKFIIPKIIDKDSYIIELKNSIKQNKKNLYLSNFCETLTNNKQICNICLENMEDNYIVTPCKHLYCLLCFNKLCKESNKYSKQNNIIHNINYNTNFNIKNRNIVSKSCEIKCPKCNNIFNKKNVYLIKSCSKNNPIVVNQNKIALLLDLYNNNLLIQKYLLFHIGYKTIYFLKKIDMFLNNTQKYNTGKNKNKNKNKNNITNTSANTNYILILNSNWKDFIKELIPINKFSNIKFINLNDLIINNFVEKQFTIYIFEPLNLNYKIKIDNFITSIILNNNIKIIKNKKNNNKFKIVNLVIKNTIDEKIANNAVILN